MLEHAIVASSDKKKRFLVLPVSIGAHLVLVAVAVWASVWTVGVPEDPPNQFEVYQVTGTPGIPDPAPPPPPPPAETTPADSQPVQTTPIETVSPAIVPLDIPVIDTPPVSGGGTGPGEPGGEPRGEPGGVPGGAPGGTPGGIPGGGGSSGDAPLVVGGAVKAPLTIHSVKPDYPRFARQARIEGTVIMRCVIDRQGRIRSAEVEKSVHPVLDEAALAAVRQWRFRPGKLNGQPVDVIFHLTVNFSLGR